MHVTIDVAQMLNNAIKQELQLTTELERLQANVLALRGQIALLSTLKQQAEAQQAEAQQAEAQHI